MPREVAERGDAIAALAEVFREQGYSASSLATITKQAGLGKSSLYHFFPNGKQEMAEAVLEEVRRWFEANVFMALRDPEAPEKAHPDCPVSCQANVTPKPTCSSSKLNQVHDSKFCKRTEQAACGFGTYL